MTTPKWIEDRIAALEGVTKGPWRTRLEPPYFLTPLNDIAPIVANRENAAHIANYDPDTVRKLLTLLADAHEALVEAKARFEDLGAVMVKCSVIERIEVGLDGDA